MGRNAKRMRAELLREGLQADKDNKENHPEQCLLPKAFIERLRIAGLVINDYPFFPRGHVATPSGYIVILPEESGGNRNEDYEAIYDDTNGDEALTCMPVVTIWGNETSWHTMVHQYVPGPGPGDFHHAFSSLDEVYADVMGYFFDPMNKDFLAMLRKI